MNVRLLTLGYTIPAAKDRALNHLPVVTIFTNEMEEGRISGNFTTLLMGFIINSSCPCACD